MSKKNFGSIILRPIRQGATITSALVLLAIALLSVRSIWETNHGVERLLLNHIRSATNAALASQDYLQIQRQLTQLNTSIEAAFGVKANVELFVDDLLAGQALSSKHQPWFVTRIHQEFLSQNGRQIRIDIAIDHIHQITSRLLLLLCFEILILVVFQVWKKKMSAAVADVTQSISDTLGWIQTLAERLRRNDGSETELLPNSEIEEIALVSRSMRMMAEQVQNLQKDVKAAEFSRGKFEVAAQVAHDIRAPLAVLNVLFNQRLDLDEEKDALLAGAIDRLKRISTNLLNLNRESRDEPLSILNLQAVVSSCLAQKCAQFCDRPNLHIAFHVDPDVSMVKVLAQENELDRMISNLVNNAAEAIDGAGVIVVRQFVLDSYISLEIEDTGRGISPDILASIGKRSFTYGKNEGNGLGVYHAKQKIESWGGRLSVESVVGKGTVMKLFFPKL